MSVKATHDDTSGAFTLLEADEPANFGPPVHVHRDAAEAFYVLDGEYILFIEGREHRRGAADEESTGDEGRCGSPLMAARGGLMSEWPPHDGPSRSHEGPSEENPRVPPTHQRQITNRGSQHGMEIRGPVPEGYL